MFFRKPKLLNSKIVFHNPSCQQFKSQDKQFSYTSFWFLEIKKVETNGYSRLRRRPQVQWANMFCFYVALSDVHCFFLWLVFDLIKLIRYRLKKNLYTIGDILHCLIFGKKKEYSWLDVIMKVSNQQLWFIMNSVAFSVNCFSCYDLCISSLKGVTDCIYGKWMQGFEFHG